MKACQWSHFRIVKALVEAGANVHWHAKVISIYHAPICFICASSTTAVYYCLVLQYDDSPFSRAAGEGCRPIMDYLISKGVAVGPSEVMRYW